MRNTQFGALLSEGLSSVARRHHKTLRAIDLEITRELALKEWTVQGWRRGYVPSLPEHVAFLARYCVVNGRIQQAWAHSFLLQARYAEPEPLLRELFPSLQASSGRAPIPHVYHNLPPQHGEFLPRPREMARVLEGLGSAWPVISIEGFAGTGKTTLAIAAARRCLAGPDAAIAPPFQAVAWISARDRLDKKLWLNEVLNTIAYVLDYPYIAQLSADQKQMAVDQLLRVHRALVVVDNFETIEDPDLATWMLQVPEPSKVLITTRHGQLRSAWEAHLSGLDEPEALQLIRQHARRLGISKAESAPARQLVPLVSVTQGNPRALAMAISYLKGGHRQLPEIVEGLHAASESLGDLFESLFEWHWAALTADARRLLLVMAFFADTVSLQALGTTAGLDGEALEAAIEQLVTMSLFDPQQVLSDQADRASQEPQGAEEYVLMRYRVHPLTRAFTISRLAHAEAQEWELRARERWVAWYRDFAREHAGGGQAQWTIRFDLLHDEWTNLLAVFAWCAANARYAELRGFWLDNRIEQVAHALGFWHDMFTWGDWLTAEAERLADWSTVVHSLASKSWALIQLGRTEHLAEVGGLLARVWSLRGRTSLATGLALVIPGSALRLRQRRYARALWWLARAEDLLARGDLDQQDRARLLIHIPFYRGLTHFERREYALAKADLFRAIENAESFGWRQPIIHLRNTLADIALAEHDLDGAERLLREGLPAAEREDDRRRVACYKRSLAHLARARGQPADASRWAAEALDGFERLGMAPEAAQMRQFATLTLAIE